MPSFTFEDAIQSNSPPTTGQNSFTFEEAQPAMGKLEATARGAVYGAAQQPRDVLAALYAKTFGDIPFKEGLAEANKMSLEGAQGEAMQERPGYFTGGQIAGNIGTSIVPAGMVTKGIGMTAPALSKLPVAGEALANLAKGISASKGLVGIPAAGAVQGGTSSAMTEGDLSGALPGAIGAGVLGTLGKVVRPIAKDAISKARQGYVDILKQIGIEDLSPAQLTGNKNLGTIESVLAQMLPTAGAARKKSEGQLRKFTQAALSKAGINADEITPEIRAAAEKSFGDRYTNMFAGKMVDIDEPVLKTVSEITTKQLQKLPSDVKPIIQSYLTDIVQAPGRKLTGEAYQEARSNLTKQAHSLAARDSFTAGTLRKIRDSLDDAAIRSIPEAEAGKLKQLNREYSNYKTIQKAASRISENSLEGVLSPSALAQAVETSNKAKGQKGYGDLYNLSRAGRSVLTDNIPNSGTAQRLAAQQLLTLGAGSGTYAFTKDPELSLGVAGATLGGPKAFQLLLDSPAAQRYFTKGIPLVNSASTPIARELAALYAAQKDKK